ncbi:hypothetical protein Gotri_015916, partial [Gossypium trilobum]|nr:hypothetical protein [Gossypium trilobum]
MSLLSNADWGPIVVAVVLFILLSPGMMFQLPTRTRVIEFGNMCTSGIAILTPQWASIVLGSSWAFVSQRGIHRVEASCWIEVLST